MKRVCSGYRDQLNLAFRDETAKTRERSQRLQLRAHSIRSAGKATRPSGVSRWANGDSLVWASLPSPSAENLVICHFYSATMENLSDQDPARHLHSHLPNLYARSDPGSALRLATEAISYAVSLKLVPDATQLSRRRYIQATRAVRTALQDLHEAGTDHILYAILLLCGYEVALPPKRKI